MERSTWLTHATARLQLAGIGTARLDALVLLEDVLNTNRTQILAHLDTAIDSQGIDKLNKLLGRRAEHEPLAYIRGKTEFYGREFIISKAVLEPRPESETMIELLIKWPNLPVSPRLADVGTGSGALGITAALELPEAAVDLLDISSEALQIAKLNVISLTTGILVQQSDLLETAPHTYDVLLCNLPYVPDTHVINQAATHEPKIAIFGGPDGLDVYRRLFSQLTALKHKPLLILTESLPPQHNALEHLALNHGYILTEEDDFIQAFTRQADSR